MRATLLQHAEHLAQPQPCPTCVFAQQRVGQAGGFKLLPQSGGGLGGAATLFNGAHHVGGALVRQHIAGGIGKQIVVHAHVSYPLRCKPRHSPCR